MSSPAVLRSLERLTDTPSYWMGSLDDGGGVRISYDMGRLIIVEIMAARAHSRNLLFHVIFDLQFGDLTDQYIGEVEMLLIVSRVLILGPGCEVRS